MTLERFSLDGKVAVVTGASRGIGRAIALGLAHAGADVCVAARSEPDLESLAGEISGAGRRALPVVTDMTERDQVQRLVDTAVAELGHIDVLVNNAGGTRFMAPLLALRPDGWHKAIRLNLTAVFDATQIVAQAMAAAGRRGSIVQIASVAGVVGAPGLSFYSAAKGGVRLMTQAAAKELASTGIRLNTIAPGWIATDLNAGLRADEASSEYVVSMIPMGRWGTPDEIVGAAIFLASDASSFVTGATLVIDGGQTA